MLSSGRPCTRQGRRVPQSGPRPIAADDRPKRPRRVLSRAARRGDREILAIGRRSVFTLADFAEHTSNFIDPVSTSYRGYDVWELPPNGQGIAVLQMLNLLEPFDLKSMGPQSAEALHLMIEAKKLAYEDRAKYYADPDFAKLPVATLISKPYAARRGSRIEPDRANQAPVPGNPMQADTIYMTVVDKDFNASA